MSESGPSPVNAAHLAWLDGELREWQREGLVDGTTSTAIRARYVELPPAAQRQGAATRILLWLGGAFVGVGLIWLVASNLDRLSPLLRFLVVAVIWLGLIVGSERLGGALAATGRMLAAGAFGAVVFQAAQSLQVPAYEPRLLLSWGLGAGVYAYAVRSHPALVVALGTLTGWFVWETARSAHGILGFILAMLLAAVVMTSAGLLHPPAWDSFAGVWRFVGAGLLFAGLFAASLPAYDKRGDWPLRATLAVAVTVVVAALAVVRTRTRTDKLELGGMTALAGLGCLLALWWPGRIVAGPNGVGSEDLSPQMWLRTGASLLVFLVAVAWIAVLAGWRASPALAALAMAAIVVYTTVQSWAVFAPIVSGAALFLLVGSIMLTTGVLAERTRRRMARHTDDAATEGSAS